MDYDFFIIYNAPLYKLIKHKNKMNVEIKFNEKKIIVE